MIPRLLVVLLCHLSSSLVRQPPARSTCDALEDLCAGTYDHVQSVRQHGVCWQARDCYQRQEDATW